MYPMYMPLTRYVTCKQSPPFCGLYFFFVDGIIYRTNVFNTREIQYIYYFFFACAFDVEYKRLLCNPKYTPMFSSKKFIE